jgi:hypothetical protein
LAACPPPAPGWAGELPHAASTTDSSSAMKPHTMDAVILFLRILINPLSFNYGFMLLITEVVRELKRLLNEMYGL